MAISHVIWIWMENHDAGSVLDNGNARFENQLAAQCGSSATYRSVGSPSLPNYLGATSGTTSDVHDDAAPSAHPLTIDNLFRQVRAAGGTSRSYEEGMAQPCELDGSGRYAVKHNPAAYYTAADDRAACQRDDFALGDSSSGALATDLANDGLASFTMITPDLCHDTHDCPVSDGDAWLAEWIPTITASRPYRDGTTAVFVVWDEPTPMPLLVIAPSVPAGVRPTATTFDHYSLLRTTEELLGLPLIGAANNATSMRAAFAL